jgi:hypothetical protein
MNKAYCVKCFFEYPVDVHGINWKLGFLKPLDKAPAAVKERLESMGVAGNEVSHVCGGCFHDTLDELRAEVAA